MFSHSSMCPPLNQIITNYFSSQVPSTLELHKKFHTVCSLLIPSFLSTLFSFNKMYLRCNYVIANCDIFFLLRRNIPLCEHASVCVHTHLMMEMQFVSNFRLLQTKWFYVFYKKYFSE